MHFIIILYMQLWLLQMKNFDNFFDGYATLIFSLETPFLKPQGGLIINIGTNLERGLEFITFLPLGLALLRNLIKRNISEWSLCFSVICGLHYMYWWYRCKTALVNWCVTTFTWFMHTVSWLFTFRNKAI